MSISFQDTGVDHKEIQGWGGDVCCDFWDALQVSLGNKASGCYIVILVYAKMPLTGEKDKQASQPVIIDNNSKSFYLMANANTTTFDSKLLICWITTYPTRNDPKKLSLILELFFDMLKKYIFLIYKACLQINPLTTFTNTRKGKIINSHELNMSVQTRLCSSRQESNPWPSVRWWDALATNFLAIHDSPSVIVTKHVTLQKKNPDLLKCYLTDGISWFPIY